MTDSFTLDDLDEPEFICIEVEFIEQDALMLTVLDKETKEELKCVTVNYSDFISGILLLKRPNNKDKNDR